MFTAKCIFAKVQRPFGTRFRQRLPKAALASAVTSGLAPLAKSIVLAAQAGRMPAAPVQAGCLRSKGLPRFRLGRLRSRLDRQPGPLPRFPAARQGARFLPAGRSEFLRHPGAGRFVLSSTICDQPGILPQAQLPRLRADVLRHHPDRAPGLGAAPFKTALSPHVEHGHRFVRFPQALQFLD